MIFDPVLWGIVPLRLENSCVNIVIKIRKPDPDEKPAKLPKWYCKPCTKENEENYPVCILPLLIITSLLTDIVIIL